MVENTSFEQFDEAIIALYLTGAATPTQVEQLREWLAADEQHRRTFAEIRAVWQRSRMNEQMDNPRFVRSLNAMNRRLDRAEHDAQRRMRFAWATKLRRSVAVAAVIAVMVVAGFVYHSLTLPEEFSTYNAGNTAMHIILPDGTSVWLGAQTKLTYDESFTEDVRRVQLNGEAYFDVTHDADHPFVVNTSTLNIRVLGTVFNVKAYDNQPVSEATLAEGSIALQDKKERQIVRLHPGQQAVYDANADALSINDVYVGNLLLLRYGVDEMNDVSLLEIVKSIESTFNVLLVPQQEINRNKRYNFSLQKNAPVEDVVELLQFISGCHFEIVHNSSK